MSSRAGVEAALLAVEEFLRWEEDGVCEPEVVTGTEGVAMGHSTS